MPAQKDVLLLGNLCIEALSRLLVDIVRVYQEAACKEKDPPNEQVKKEEIQQNGNEEIIKQKNDDVSNEEHKIESDTRAEMDSKEKEKIALRLESLDTYRKDLVKFLTSHSHAGLHDNLFSVLTSQCNDIYMMKKKTRAVIQDIVPYFVNSSLRDMDFGKARMFAEAAMCQILFDHLENASKLRTLDIGRSCYWRLNVFENLSTKLKSLPELTILRIQYICTPEMISGLVDNCPNLSELDLKGSEKITDIDCDELAKCVSLTSLDITGTRITGKGCWKIIDSVKCLSWLHHCAYNCHSGALLFESRAHLFNCIKEQVIRRNAPVDGPTTVDGHMNLQNVFNLKNFWLFNPCTEDMVSTLLCPHLEHLRLDFIFQDLMEEPDVSVISQIPMLNRFQANLYDRCHVDLVSQMVENSGSKITKLELHMADDYFFAAQVHNVVARCCPNLVDLSFSGDYKARHSLEVCDNCLDFEIEMPAHPHLKNLSITGVVTDCRLQFVLNHAPAIHTLVLDGELEWLHDDTFKSILEINPLPHLERVWFNVSTTVTLETVRLLLSYENSIHTIGRLCHMGQANMTDYQRLQDLVRQNNLDVKLIWVTDERNRYEYRPSNASPLSEKETITIRKRDLNVRENTMTDH